MEKPRAISYLRFSTPEQARGDSFRRQRSMAERYAREHGLLLDETTFEDLGVSAFRGRNLQVGVFADFLTSVEEGLIAKGTYLLVESIDRISRQDVLQAVNTLDRICRAGIIVVTLSDGKRYDAKTFAEDSMSFLMACFVAIRANEESVMKSKRGKAVWEAKRSAASNAPLTSKCPAWLTLDKERQRFLVNEQRAGIVRRIFKDTIDGKGQHMIAEALNSEGVPTFGRAKMWNRSYVQKILESEATVGTYIPHTTEYVDGRKIRRPLEPVLNYYPAVVDKQTFQRVRAMRETRTAPRVGHGAKNLLGGLAKCPRCGSTMTRVSKGSQKRSGKPYLVCTTAKAKVRSGKDRSGDFVCEYRSVKLEAIERALFKHFGSVADDMPGADEVLSREIAGVKEQIRQTTVRLDNIIDAIAEGQYGAELPAGSGVSDKALQEDAKTRLRVQEVLPHRRHLVARQDAYGSLLDQLNAELEEMQRRRESANPRALRARLQTLLMKLSASAPDIAECNALMRQLFDAVTVDFDQDLLEFHWKQGGLSCLSYSANYRSISSEHLAAEP